MNQNDLRIPRSLFALSIFYGGMVCIAGVLGNKQVTLGPLSAIGPMLGLGPLAIEAGIFAFLMLVVVSSAIAELHGAVIANRLVRFGFVPLIASILLSLIVLIIPAAPDMDPARAQAFELMMGATPRIWVGGIISYGISQTLNVYVFSALKGREGGGLLWLRAGIASILSQIVDTLLFVSIAFLGVFPIRELLIGQMVVKVGLSALLVPPLIYAVVGIGRWLDRAGSER
ncbi:MAG: queuosine precursor transporter [Sphingomonas sp.]|uniref:queuosine precursor transporter n=1 Tax=Sphingomonas sp. TaxID=28214 RepID=UPI0035A95638|nr:queuosine precursor transporter [Sphingomonas sp.]